MGTSAPRHHFDSDEEMIGGPVDTSTKDGQTSGIINEDMASLDELLNQLVDPDDGDNPDDPNGHNSTED